MSKAKKPHVHAEVIRDWARGFFVEVKKHDGTWSIITTGTPLFSPDAVYRRAILSQRPHYKLINAFAAGEEIEFFNPDNGEWEYTSSPYFDKDTRYRVKKPPLVQPIIDAREKLYAICADLHENLIISDGPYSAGALDTYGDRAKVLINTAHALRAAADAIESELPDEDGTS